MNYEAFFKISYGLYIISSKSEGITNGYVANTAFQITAKPPQIAISCSKKNKTSGLIDQSNSFSISVLNKNCKTETINLFGFKSGSDIDKFANIEFQSSALGTPVVLEDCIAWFDCKVTRKADLGTHLLFIAEIVESELLDEHASPLTYSDYRMERKGMAPQNAPTHIENSKLKNTDTMKEADKKSKYKCGKCGHIYDPKIGDEKSGIPPGTAFDDLPDDWVCPTCGAAKSMFKPI